MSYAAPDASVHEKRLKALIEERQLEDLQMVFELGVSENLLRWRPDDPATRELFRLRRRVQEEKERIEKLRIDLEHKRAQRDQRDQRAVEEQRRLLIQQRQEEALRRHQEEQRMARERDEAARQQAAWEAQRRAEQEEAARQQAAREAQRLERERERQVEADRICAEQFEVQECSMCTDRVAEDLMFQAGCCAHQFHWKCAERYAKAEIGARHLEPKCPSTDGCPGRWSTVDLENATGGEMAEAVHAINIDKFRELVGERAWQCRRPGCKGFCEIDPNIAMIHCPFPECGYAWCQQCQCQWHADMNCEQFQRWKRENGKEGEDATAALIRQSCRVCGRCGHGVTKNGGCNCITCQCGYQLCWICGGPAPNHTFPCGHPTWS
eukprot:tig00000123_g6927.t1